MAMKFLVVASSSLVTRDELIVVGLFQNRTEALEFVQKKEKDKETTEIFYCVDLSSSTL